MLPKLLLSIKGRTSNPTSLVHQEMTKKTPFMNKKGEITQVKCSIELWFLSSVLPFINFYVCTMFNFNPFSTFQDMARVSNHYVKKWLMGDNSVIQCIQLRVINLMHCTSSHCHLSIIQVSFQSLLYFPRYGPDRHPL